MQFLSKARARLLSFLASVFFPIKRELSTMILAVMKRSESKSVSSTVLQSLDELLYLNHRNFVSLSSDLYLYL
jgi:hypothetical protein